MQYILIPFGSFLLIASAAAIDDPMNRGIYLLLGGFAIWMAIRVKSRKPIKIPWLCVPMGAYVILQALLLINAPLTPLAFFWVGSNLLFPLLIIMILDVTDEYKLAILIENVIIFTGVIASLVSLYEIINWYSTWIQLNGSLLPLPPKGTLRIASFLSHPVSLAGFLNIVWPIVFVRILKGSDHKKRLFYGSLLGVFLLTMYFTASRAGWLIALIEVVVILTLLFAQRIIFRLKRNDVTQGPRNIRVLVIRGGIVLLLIGFFSYMMLFVQTRATGRDPLGLSNREGIWAISKAVFLSSPFVGHGPGSFPIKYALLMDVKPDAIPLHAHANNLFLQVGAETGIVGVVILLVILIISVRTFVRTWRNPSESGTKYQLSAYAAIGISVLVHNQVEFIFNYIHNSIYTICIIIILALALRLAPKTEFLSLSKRIVYPIIILALGFYAFLVFNINDGKEIFESGLDAARVGEFEIARDQICSTTTSQNAIAVYDFQCSLANAWLLFQGADSADIEQAIFSQRIGLERDPGAPINWVNLALLEWESGDSKNALTHMRYAAQIDTINPKYRNATILLKLGWMEEQLDNEKEAFLAYTDALKRDPWLRDSLSVSQSPVFRASVSDITKDNDGLVWDGLSNLRMGSLGVAQQELESAIENRKSNPMAYAILALVNQERGELEEADINIRKAQFLSRNFRVLAIAGRIARLNGESKTAADYFAQVFAEMQNDSFTRDYHFFLYRQNQLPMVYSPFLLRGVINQEMLEDFRWYADYLLQEGDYQKSQQIKNWISKNTVE